MLSLFKSLVRPILEYCCEVWSPYLKKDIVLIEQTQISFTHRILGFTELNYWDRLEKLDLTSLQRRRETFIIIHIWKIKNNIYPNTIDLEFKLHKRTNAMRAVLKPLPKVTGKLLCKYEESFIIRACKLWNILPPILSHVTCLNSFKLQLKNFLKNVPDKPPLPGYPVLNDNSLLNQCLGLNG